MDILESGIFRVEAPPTQEETQVSDPNPICEFLLGSISFSLVWFFIIWLCDFFSTR